MKTPRSSFVRRLIAVLSGLIMPLTSHAANYQVLGWNNLGMHCMDSDYSVFSILPPYNTIEAQLIVGGHLLTNTTGYTITYEAVADPSGSINSTSQGKGNFYDFTSQLYGTVPVNTGLAGWSMPGAANAPQPMLFENTNTPAAGVHVGVNWFRAEGIPLTPYDDAMLKNPYPLMRIVARDAASNIVASSAIVLPVSDEMDCRTCHASGTQAATLPAAGWVWDGNPERDYRLNILRLHDERQFALHGELYTNALAARSFNPQGLYRGVVADGKPVLCAVCHASEALGTGSYSNTPPLTASVHSQHATAMDPVLGITLDNSANRAACYRCHPGSTTKCLRGAMGAAVATDGSMEMQCQSCHGNMSAVGSSSRVGWFMEPNCQSCHTGPATHNNGQIVYTSALIGTTPRVAVDQMFATSSNTPAPGLSLFRFSSGHGGLQCEACHGSTHAEFPSTHANDNLRNTQLQGHVGVLIECATCHVTTPNTVTGGPHGMHPVGQTWVNQHGNLFETNGATRAQCQVCHGLDYRGTILSRAQADRQLVGVLTVQLFRGAQVGCYTCHNGPNSDTANSTAPPTVANIVTNTISGQSVAITLPVSGTGAVLRIVSQPAHGSAGLAGTVATYFPEAGFTGVDNFTFAAYNGAKNSSLATATISIAQGPFSISAAASVPPSYPATWPAPFGIVATPLNVSAAPTYDWNFGDGSAHSGIQHTRHAYATPGAYNWTVISTVQSGGAQASATNSGTIVISEPATLKALSYANSLVCVWSNTPAGALLEESPTLGPDAHWTVVTNTVNSGSNSSVSIPHSLTTRFYRLRKL
jgi:PKD repeat protein